MAFDRVARILTPLAEGALQLRSMSGHERLSAPFDFTLDLLSEDPALDPSALLGAVVAVELEVPDQGVRAFSGHVTELSLVGGEGRFTAYRARVEPWLKLLSYNVDSRVFQHVRATSTGAIAWGPRASWLRSPRVPEPRRCCDTS